MRKYFLLTLALLAATCLASCGEKSPIEKLFSSKETLTAELKGKLLCSEDNQCVVYFKDKNPAKNKFEVDAFVDGEFKEIARGKYTIDSDENLNPRVKFQGHGVWGTMNATELDLTTSTDGKNYHFTNFRIITLEEAEAFFK